MLMTNSSPGAVRSLVLGTALVLGGCARWAVVRLARTTPADATRTPQYLERPIEQIYADAWRKISADDWEDAAKQFDEVDRQHPYSVWARRAMLM